MMLKQALQQKCVHYSAEQYSGMKNKRKTWRMARSQTGSTTRSKTGDLTKKDGVKTGLCIHRGLLRIKNRWKKVKVQEQVIKQK